MNRFKFFALVVLAVLNSLSSCVEDKTPVLYEDEAATRSDMELGQPGMKVFSNSFISLTYPDSLKIYLSQGRDKFRDDFSMFAEDYTIHLSFMSYVIDENQCLEEVAHPNSGYKMLEKTVRLIDGRKVKLHTYDNDSNLYMAYAYHNEKKRLS